MRSTRAASVGSSAARGASGPAMTRARRARTAPARRAKRRHEARGTRARDAKAPPDERRGSRPRGLPIDMRITEPVVLMSGCIGGAPSRLTTARLSGSLPPAIGSARGATDPEFGIGVRCSTRSARARRGRPALRRFDRHRAARGRDRSIFESARAAVQLVIGLVGIMVFFLGLMRIAFDAGFRDVVARGLTPLTRRLFPEIPSDHPALGAIVMNLASNVLGMGNAATPFGLKAMSELARLNAHSGSASNAMVLFLAINSSAITLLPPLGTIGVRARPARPSPGRSGCRRSSRRPARRPWPCSPTTRSAACRSSHIVPICRGPRRGRRGRCRRRRSGNREAAARSGVRPAALAAARRLPRGDPSLRLAPRPLDPGHRPRIGPRRGPARRAAVLDLSRADLRGAPLRIREARRVYDAMVAGGREGMAVAVRIVPYLVVMLVAVAMLRASGALDSLTGAIDPFTRRLGVPAEVLPMALIRPLSGSGAFGVMAEIFEHHGPDSFIGLMTSTLMGSTETTFYVLAVYLGAAGVVDGRHALFACLAGDVAGFAGAVAACHFFFG
ncbi:MAG: nucleoside recognition domain-containing protein [Myxococcota bacterium]